MIIILILWNDFEEARLKFGQVIYHQFFFKFQLVWQRCSRREGRGNEYHKPMLGYWKKYKDNSFIMFVSKNIFRYCSTIGSLLLFIKYFHEQKIIGHKNKQTNKQTSIKRFKIYWNLVNWMGRDLTFIRFIPPKVKGNFSFSEKQHIYL